MSRSTPGFIVNMFNADIDRSGVALRTLDRMIKYLDSTI